MLDTRYRTNSIAMLAVALAGMLSPRVNCHAAEAAAASADQQIHFTRLVTKHYSYSNGESSRKGYQVIIVADMLSDGRIRGSGRCETASENLRGETPRFYATSQTSDFAVTGQLVGDHLHLTWPRPEESLSVWYDLERRERGGGLGKRASHADKSFELEEQDPLVFEAELLERRYVPQPEELSLKKPVRMTKRVVTRITVGATPASAEDPNLRALLRGQEEFFSHRILLYKSLEAADKLTAEDRTAWTEAGNQLASVKRQLGGDSSTEEPQPAPAPADPDADRELQQRIAELKQQIANISAFEAQDLVTEEDRKLRQELEAELEKLLEQLANRP